MECTPASQGWLGDDQGSGLPLHEPTGLVGGRVEWKGGEDIDRGVSSALLADERQDCRPY